MPFNFYFGSPFLLQDVQPQGDPSNGPPNGHSGNDNALPTIEEVEDSDLQGLPSGQPLSIGMTNYNQQSANAIDIVDGVSSAAQSSIPGMSNSGQLLTRKRRDCRSDDSVSVTDGNNEVTADGSYSHRTKIRVIQDPQLRLQNDQLLNQLDEERVKVNALSNQLREIQQGQVTTAWRARGIYDEMSSQLQAAVSARDSAVEALAEVTRALDMTSSGEERIQPLSLIASNESASINPVSATTDLVQHAQALRAATVASQNLLEASHVQLRSIQVEALQASENHSRLLVAALAERDNALRDLEQSRDIERRLTHEYEQRLQEVLAEHQQRFQQELEEQIRQERQNISVQVEETTQQRLQELERDQEESHQSKMCRAQEEHHQQMVEFTRTREELEDRIQELERVRTQEIQEREQQRQVEQQDLSAQIAVEVQQRLDEQAHLHQQSLQAQMNRMEEEHRQSSAVIREEMESRIRELEQVRAQEVNLVEQAHSSAAAASRSEAAFESILSHDTEVIADLRAQVERLEAQIASPASFHVLSTTDSAQAPQSNDTGPSIQRSSNSDAYPGLSDWAHDRLPANPQLARIRAAETTAHNRPSQRRVSFESGNIEETITPPLRISRPYSSTTPQTPRLRLPTQQPSSPASMTPQSLPSQQPSILAFPLRQNYTPSLNYGGAFDRPQSPSPSSRASSCDASPMLSRRSTIGVSDNVYSMLNNLTGVVNSLRTELNETRNSIAAIESPASSGSRRIPRSSPYKALTTRRIKERSRVDMMKVVRDALKSKLDITHDKDIKEAIQNHRHIASPGEVDDFDNGLIPAPSLTPFRPYWDEIWSPWNESLAEQFTDEILAAGRELNGETRESIKNHFFQRLVTLKKELRRQTPRSHETEAQATQRAERQHQITLAKGRVQHRQFNLFNSREEICREGLKRPDCAIWELLLRLVLALGTEGQSSDESEDETDTFTVRHRPWRNDHVTELLRFIDSYRETLNNYGNNRSGKPFRTRKRQSNPPLTHDRPIMRLPRNLYSTNFLSTRRPDQLNQLDIQDAIDLPEFEDEQPRTGTSHHALPPRIRSSRQTMSSPGPSRQTGPSRHLYYNSDADN